MKRKLSVTGVKNGIEQNKLTFGPRVACGPRPPK